MKWNTFCWLCKQRFVWYSQNLALGCMKIWSDTGIKLAYMQVHQYTIDIHQWASVSDIMRLGAKERQRLDLHS